MDGTRKEPATAGHTLLPWNGNGHDNEIGSALDPEAPARAAHGQAATATAPEVRGKFLFRGDEKLYVRGVTYGTFRPDAHGSQFPDPLTVERDFARWRRRDQRRPHLHRAAALAARRRRRSTACA